tara:strand:+ start:469 stop:615 length:147 start_codon:yes stop_codon:yes gene_type:complete
MTVPLWNAKESWPMLLPEVVKKKKIEFDKKTKKIELIKIKQIELLLIS